MDQVAICKIHPDHKVLHITVTINRVLNMGSSLPLIINNHLINKVLNIFHLLI